MYKCTCVTPPSISFIRHCYALNKFEVVMQSPKSHKSEQTYRDGRVPSKHQLDITRTNSLEATTEFPVLGHLYHQRASFVLFSYVKYNTDSTHFFKVFILKTRYVVKSARAAHAQIWIRFEVSVPNDFV